MTTRWRITLLGGLSAERGPWSVARFPTQKTAALLAALAFRPGRERSREALVEMLWPDLEPHLARNNVSKALSALRHALEPPGVEAGSVIVAGRAGVALSRDAVETDLEAFEAAQGDEALSLYGGALLPGHAEAWVEPERARLRDRFVALAVEAASRAADPRAAVALARRAAAEAPLSERAQAALIEHLASAGEPAAAIAAYGEFTALLARELGSTPGRALTERAAAIARRAGLREASPASSVRPERSAEGGAKSKDLPASGAVTPAPPALPLELRPFFGREDALGLLDALLAPRGGDARLVTITGPGGMGKTRLALEAARRLGPGYEGRAHLVPLAEALSADAIPAAILGALGLPAEGPAPPLERIARAVEGGAGALLVLDNLEHLGGAAAPVVRALLERAPSLRCLATSRRRLGIAGERELALAPLAVPPEGLADLARLAATDSVRLLVDRAQAVRAGFALDAASAPAIAALCRRLEGIPLACALAAGRLQVLSPSELLARLAPNLDALASRDREAPARHRTLRAAVAWSIDALPPEGRRFLGALSVFRGGFDLEAAEAVAGSPERAVAGEASPPPDPLVLDRLSDLCECSLLLVDEAQGRARYRLLEPVREAAADLVPPEEREALARRHAGRYAGVAEEAAARLGGAEQASALARLDLEAGNLAAALAWAALRPERAEAGLRLASALSYFWLIRGRHAEARAALDRLLAAPGLPPRVRAEGLRAAGRVAGASGDNTAAPRFIEEALAIYASLGDRRTEGRLSTSLGAFLRNRGEVARARPLLERGVLAARAEGDRRESANALLHLGILLHADGAAAAARAFAEAAALCREAGDRFLLTVVLGHEALARAEGGDAARGGALLEEAHATARPLGAAAESRVLMAIGSFAADQGDRPRARRAFEETLALAGKNAERHVEAAALLGLGRLDLADGLLAEARPRLERALAAFRELPFAPGIAFGLLSLALLARRRGDLREARRLLEEALPHAESSTGSGAALPTVLEALASVALEEGDRARAADLLARADARREALGAPVPPAGREEIHALRRSVGRAPGPPGAT